MNSFGGAEELLRHGRVTFDGEVLFEGFIDRSVVAHFNAHFPAIGLRINSTPLQVKDLPPVPDFNDENEVQEEKPPVKQKPTLRIVK